MIRPLICAGLAALCLALPTQAQRMGSANRGAPTLEESIKFPDGAMLQLEYVSITWAQGQMMNAAMSKDGSRARSRINSTAEERPLGKLEVSTGFELGGKMIDSGKYNVMFTINDDLKWHLVLAGDSRYDWPLALQSTKIKRTRLDLDLSAGDEDGTGQLRVSFGDQTCTVPFAPKPKDAK